LIAIESREEPEEEKEGGDRRGARGGRAVRSTDRQAPRDNAGSRPSKDERKAIWGRPTRPSYMGCIGD